MCCALVRVSFWPLPCSRRPMITKNTFDDLCSELPVQGGFLQGIDAARADHIGPGIECGQVIGRKSPIGEALKYIA